jgi:hypothetical protein
MKKQLAAILSVFALITTVCHSQFIDLASFGSSSFTIDAGATTAPNSQNSTGITFSPTMTLGDTLGGVYNSAPFDWSSFGNGDFAIKMSIVGANPNLPFSLTLFDTNFNLLNLEGTTVGVTTDTYIPLTFVSIVGGSPLADVAGAQFTWDGGGAINATISEVAAVPEPSTYALLTLGALALGGYAARRRNRK